MFKTLSIFTIGILLCILPNISHSQESLEDLILRSEVYENLVYSGRATFVSDQDVYYEGSIDSVYSSTHETINCTFNTDKYYSENETIFEDEQGKRTFINTTLCTSEKCIILTLNENSNGLFYPTANIYPVEYRRVIEDYVLSYMGINGIKISDFLSGNVILDKNPVKTVQLLRKESLSGVDCFVIRMDFADGDMIITAWLSDEHQLKPIQVVIENYSLNEIKKYDRTDYEYIMVNDVWCTKKITTQRIRDDILLSNKVVDFIEYEVNVPIDDDVFLWTLPSGIQAYDYRVNRYVTIPQ